MLRALFLGEISADDLEVRRRMKDDPAFATAYRDLESVAASLAGAARRELEDRGRAERVDPASPEVSQADGRIEAEVARFLSERRSAVRGRPSMRRVLAVAAVVLVGGIAAFQALRDGSTELDAPAAGTPEARLLGVEGTGVLAPSGAVERYSVFRWPNQRPENGWFVLRIFEEGAASWSKPLFESPPLQDGEFEASEELAARWPDRIRWEVLVHDASGLVVDSADADAARSD